jgi:hypothetical protein
MNEENLGDALKNGRVWHIREVECPPEGLMAWEAALRFEGQCSLCYVAYHGEPCNNQDIHKVRLYPGDEIEYRSVKANNINNWSCHWWRLKFIKPKEEETKLGALLKEKGLLREPKELQPDHIPLAGSRTPGQK